MSLLIEFLILETKNNYIEMNRMNGVDDLLQTIVVGSTCSSTDGSQSTESLFKHSRYEMSPQTIQKLVYKINTHRCILFLVSKTFRMHLFDFKTNFVIRDLFRS